MRRNDSDFSFVTALRNCERVSYHVQKGTLEAGLKGVHMWYAKEIGKRKEEEVLRDLLIPLLKPLLTPTTVGSLFHTYKRIALWILVCLNRLDLGVLYKRWISEYGDDKCLLFPVVIE